MSTVIIACKLANGLYLDVGEQRVAVNGFAKGFIDETGFGLTYGIDAELWKAWLAENKDRDLVTNGLIFAHEQESSAKDEAKEKQKTKSGTERIQPEQVKEVEAV
ncbi:hypothetical protein KKJ17_14855 [Xenorhabdus bovienii]|uniref:hypothetical protein n=1 Tax=Xenorhabdus bovienii TaxID=40576 RepID=UPI00237CFEDC|nr:hypothetical protein [Xenorhabdus bovienii]MDE1486081.1 hypothetical protein [Xenorhabdus bovienii]MDE9478818.1 hypothetical protein [Xenorhabdus bovienii]MDE9518972.1 hypothetical protein [Xenorhabdus bovienii]MDE9531720.1 hypothetical protein [Xenorhabdus bovienii]